MAGREGRPVPLALRALPVVLNEHWPPDADQVTERDEAIMVTARIVWRDAGVEYLHGQTNRWRGEHVYVCVDDERLEAGGVWLRPADVYRALPDDARGLR